MFDPRLNLLYFESLLPSHVIDDWNNQTMGIESEQGKVGKDKAEGREDNQTRSCEIRWVPFKKQSKLYTDISKVLLSIIDAEMVNFRVDINRTLEIQHTTYNTNNFYTRHVDFNIASSRSSLLALNRKISLVVMMSDPSEYQGGDLVVGNVTIPKSKGTICMFLPFVPHEVKPVTSGTRRSLVVWAMGPEWR